MYIDASQNDYGDRLVAPYCLRAYKQPYVSAPLSWQEVNNNLDRHDFKIDNMQQRVAQVGDLFENLLDDKVQKANTKVLKELTQSLQKG